MRTTETGSRRGALPIFRMLVAVYSALLMAPLASAADYRIAPAPTWVVPHALNTQANPPLGQANNGVYYLLVDQQAQLDAAGKTTYRRIASRALNARGMETVAQIAIDFDPSFQSLTLHSLKLHRDGRTQERLASARIKVLQRETELEYKIYDGSKTVDIVLDDVRTGDIVEYAYSVRGSNPVFRGIEFWRVDMQWSAPVHQLHRRLRAPAERQLHFRAHHTELQRETTIRDRWVDHVWRTTDVAPVARHQDAPRWYDPYSAVEWSEFADWAAVARWAEPLYAAPREPAGPLRTEIDRIASTAATPEERIASVLQFVQSQVRYLGVEMGPGSHAPRPPELVFARRYGDCKDKVLLAVTMLRALGVTADPALVSTSLRQTIDAVLPSPGAFNHVIFRARVGERDLWLDPTLFPQKGSLDRISQANYGRALVLDGQAQGLSPMPMAQPSQRRRVVDVHIDASKGFGEAGTMQVMTTHEGASADSIRNTLRNENLVDLQREYLNYYLRSYPRLTVAKPLTFSDDEVANRLVTGEHYRFDSLWAKDDSGGKKQVVYLYVPDMKSMLRRPDDMVRAAPLAISHPEHVTVNVTAKLPEERPINLGRNYVWDPAFEFSATVSHEEQELRLNYEYRSLADHVKPSDLATYIDHLERARGNVGYTLRPLASKQPSNPVTWLAVGAGSLVCVLAWLVLLAAAIVVGRGWLE